MFTNQIEGKIAKNWLTKTDFGQKTATIMTICGANWCFFILSYKNAEQLSSGARKDLDQSVSFAHRSGRRALVISRDISRRHASIFA